MEMEFINFQAIQVRVPKKLREIGFFARHPGIALKIGDVRHLSLNISTVSTRFSSNLSLPKNKNGEGSFVNAFRHILWQAIISADFGNSIAAQVGNAHEVNPLADLSIRTFSSLSSADEIIDLLNNKIGRGIGRKNTDANPKELAIITLNYFKKTGAWVALKQNNNKYEISQTKLTENQFNKASKVLKTCNKYGYTPSQWIERQKEVDKINQSKDASNETLFMGKNLM